MVSGVCLCHRSFDHYGNLSKDGRHINFTSKDEELVELFKSCLNLTNKISQKASGTSKIKKYHFIQFGDVVFYKFLKKIGLTPAKSKSIGAVRLPDVYFFDFLRGHFDGDGTFYSYWDKRWRSSFMFYTVFISASKEHIDWLRQKLRKLLAITGHINRQGGNSGCYQLKYAKKESFKLLRQIYKKPGPALGRKALKIKRALAIIGEKV